MSSARTGDASGDAFVASDDVWCPELQKKPRRPPRPGPSRLGFRQPCLFRRLLEACISGKRFWPHVRSNIPRT